MQNKHNVLLQHSQVRFKLLCDFIFLSNIPLKISVWSYFYFVFLCDFVYNEWSKMREKKRLKRVVPCSQNYGLVLWVNSRNGRMCFHSLGDWCSHGSMVGRVDTVAQLPSIVIVTSEWKGEVSDFVGSNSRSFNMFTGTHTQSDTKLRHKT